MSARVKSRTHRWFVLLFAAVTVSAAVLATPASAIDTPIGRLGEPLRVEFRGIVADVTVHDVLPSDVPPGFGYPPRALSRSGVQRGARRQGDRAAPRAVEPLATR